MAVLTRIYPRPFIIFCFHLIFAVIFIAFSPTACRAGKDLNFNSLQRRLIADPEDKFDPEMIGAIYKDSGLGFDIKGISSYFRHRESKLDYDQFLKPAVLAKAKKYMYRHHADLLKAEMEYGVDRHVITAIILVETRLGTYVGNRSVLRILSTMAALSDPRIREAFWNEIPARNRISREEYDRKAREKSEWAYKELKAFLKYAVREQIDPIEINGSYAGAIGIAQFMPSNVLVLGRDGDHDGKIDLFDHEDAIVSIANFLKYYGWVPGISRQEAAKVLYHYNHSSYYVNTVLDVAERLKAGSL